MQMCTNPHCPATQFCCCSRLALGGHWPRLTQAACMQRRSTLPNIQVTYVQGRGICAGDIQVHLLILCQWHHAGSKPAGCSCTDHLCHLMAKGQQTYLHLRSFRLHRTSVQLQRKADQGNPDSVEASQSMQPLSTSNHWLIVSTWPNRRPVPK